MELYFNILSLVIGIFFGLIAGVLIASKLNLFLKISKKEDYEAKVEELDQIMQTILDEQEENGIKAKELFPPELEKDYGIPRPLK